MEHSCGCGHNHNDDNAPTITPEERKKLEEEIAKAGFQVKEDADGNIIIVKKST